MTMMMNLCLEMMLSSDGKNIFRIFRTLEEVQIASSYEVTVKP